MTVKALSVQVAAMTESVAKVHDDLLALTEILVMQTQRFNRLEAHVSTIRVNQECLQRNLDEAIANDVRATG